MSYDGEVSQKAAPAELDDIVRALARIGTVEKELTPEAVISYPALLNAPAVLFAAGGLDADASLAAWAVTVIAEAIEALPGDRDKRVAAAMLASGDDGDGLPYRGCSVENRKHRVLGYSAETYKKRRGPVLLAIATRLNTAGDAPEIGDHALLQRFVVAAQGTLVHLAYIQAFGEIDFPSTTAVRLGDYLKTRSDFTEYAQLVFFSFGSTLEALHNVNVERPPPEEANPWTDALFRISTDMLRAIELSNRQLSNLRVCIRASNGEIAVFLDAVKSRELDAVMDQFISHCAYFTDPSDNKRPSALPAFAGLLRRTVVLFGGQLPDLAPDSVQPSLFNDWLAGENSGIRALDWEASNVPLAMQVAAFELAKAAEESPRS